MNTDSTLTLMSQPSATSPSEFPTATSERRTELAHSSLADSDIQDSTLRQRYSSTSNYANDKQKPKAFSSSSSSSEEMKEESYFECNICLATAREPVVTLCGHLVRTSFDTYCNSTWNIARMDYMIFFHNNLNNITQCKSSIVGGVYLVGSILLSGKQIRVPYALPLSQRIKLYRFT